MLVFKPKLNGSDRSLNCYCISEQFKVYGGSLGLMMSAMVESRGLTEADIAELSAILERAGGKK